MVEERRESAHRDDADRQARDAIEPGPGAHRAAGLSNVSFIGPVPSERYPDLLRAADVLLVNERTSVGDMALPSKLTSYFAARRPVIAAVSANGAHAQQIACTDGAAHIVAPGQPAELARAIEALSSGGAWSASMAAAGGRFADAHLSRATAARRVRELVSDLRAYDPKV